MNKIDDDKNKVYASGVKLDCITLLARMLDGPHSHAATSSLYFVSWPLQATGWHAC